MSALDHAEKSIGFCLYTGAEELDFVGPWEIFTMWRSYARGPATIETVAPKPEPVHCAKGLTVLPDTHFDIAPKYDILVVPGGFAALDVADCVSFISFVRRQATDALAVLSVCTGSWILYKAGLLRGKRATTHWKFMEEFSSVSEIDVVSRRYVRDGRIWTAAGVSAGIDMSLAFIAEAAGNESAHIVQANAEYFPDPPRLVDSAANNGVPGYVRARGASA